MQIKAHTTSLYSKLPKYHQPWCSSSYLTKYQHKYRIQPRHLHRPKNAEIQGGHRRDRRVNRNIPAHQKKTYGLRHIIDVQGTQSNP